MTGSKPSWRALPASDAPGKGASHGKRITLLPGDGIGPEIVAQAAAVLERIRTRFGHRFQFSQACIGGNAIDLYGTSLPEQSLRTCLEADSVLPGAVGGPKWDHVQAENRPETTLLRL